MFKVDDDIGWGGNFCFNGVFVELEEVIGFVVFWDEQFDVMGFIEVYEVVSSGNCYEEGYNCYDFGVFYGLFCYFVFFVEVDVFKVVFDVFWLLEDWFVIDENGY